MWISIRSFRLFSIRGLFVFTHFDTFYVLLWPGFIDDYIKSQSSFCFGHIRFWFPVPTPNLTPHLFDLCSKPLGSSGGRVSDGLFAMACSQLRESRDAKCHGDAPSWMVYDGKSVYKWTMIWGSPLGIGHLHNRSGQLWHINAYHT